jgi:hypothetical protein
MGIVGISGYCSRTILPPPSREEMLETQEQSYSLYCFRCTVLYSVVYYFSNINWYPSLVCCSRVYLFFEKQYIKCVHSFFLFFLAMDNTHHHTTTRTPP